MKLFKWANTIVKKMDWLDVGLVKISVAAVILLIAKLWPPILCLAWYWYAVIFVIAAVKPVSRVMGK